MCTIVRFMAEVTRTAFEIEQGDPSATSELLPLVYDELRELAAAKLAYQQPGQTLSATGLVHEVYLRLEDAEQGQQWNSRGHFFAAAAESMRRMLVEDVRRRCALKRGGQMNRVGFIEDAQASTHSPPLEDRLALEEALDNLAADDWVKAQLAKLRFFAGFSQREAADELRIYRATADRYWAYAKVRLFCEIYNPRGSSVT